MIPGSIPPGSFLMPAESTHFLLLRAQAAGAGPGAGHASTASDLSVWESLSTPRG